MNYRIPSEVALRIKNKLNEYLKLVARLEELEKDPYLISLLDIPTIQENTHHKKKSKTVNYQPIKPIIKYVEEVFASLPMDTLLDTYVLIDKMKEIGWQTTADNVYLTAYGVLRRESRKENSHIVKVGSKWKWTS